MSVKKKNPLLLLNILNVIFLLSSLLSTFVPFVSKARLFCVKKSSYSQYQNTPHEGLLMLYTRYFFLAPFKPEKRKTEIIQANIKMAA